MMAMMNVGAGVSPVGPIPSVPRPGETRAGRETGEGLKREAAECVSAVTQGSAVDWSREELRAVAESFGQLVSVVNEGISIRIDETTDLLITEIINKETNEVIKQIPPEELVRLAGRLRKFLGILLDIEI